MISIKDRLSKAYKGTSYYCMNAAITFDTALGEVKMRAVTKYRDGLKPDDVILSDQNIDQNIVYISPWQNLDTYFIIDTEWFLDLLQIVENKVNTDWQNDPKMVHILGNSNIVMWFGKITQYRHYRGNHCGRFNEEEVERILESEIDLDMLSVFRRRDVMTPEDMEFLANEDKVDTNTIIEYAVQSKVKSAATPLYRLREILKQDNLINIKCSAEDLVAWLVLQGFGNPYFSNCCGLYQDIGGVKSTLPKMEPPYTERVKHDTSTIFDSVISLDAVLSIEPFRRLLNYDEYFIQSNRDLAEF